MPMLKDDIDIVEKEKGKQTKNLYRRRVKKAQRAAVKVLTHVLHRPWRVLLSAILLIACTCTLRQGQLIADALSLIISINDA